jgi:hypothetical protein
MKLKDLYDIAIKKAMKDDMRSKGELEKVLKETKQEYSRLSGIDKKYFDKENLIHPYSDTRILNGNGSEEIKNIMVGIDIDVAELILADRLKEQGYDIDLILSHHPSGHAFAQLHKVMDVQPAIWTKYGLDKEIAMGIMKERMEEVARNIAPLNHTRTVDAARLLGIPFMCIHTAADNCVARFLQNTFNQKKPGKLKNILNILKSLPEYKDAVKNGNGPSILIGEPDTPAGQVFVDMTGGASGPDRMFSRLSQTGIKTIVGMHCKETARKTASSEFINYVIAGHMASDTLGLNLLFDEVEKKETLNFIECSGFKRFRR